MKICFKRKKTTVTTYEFCAIAFLYFGNSELQTFKPFLRAQRRYINSKVYGKQIKSQRQPPLRHMESRGQDEKSILLCKNVPNKGEQQTTSEQSPNGYFLTAAHCLLDTGNRKIHQGGWLNKETTMLQSRCYLDVRI